MDMSRLILGLNTNHGDSAAALVTPSGITAAIAEERLSREKHTAAFPRRAIAEVLRISGVSLEDITDIAVARDPRANALQKAKYLVRYPLSAMPMAWKRLRVHRKVRSIDQRIVTELGAPDQLAKARLHHVEHHLAHLASAFYGSRFDSCAGFSCDGAGDFATTMAASCHDRAIDVLGRTYWPHSLGVFYTAMTQFIGFDKYGEEYKVMGLAAYGENSFGHLMQDVVRWDSRRGLRLDLSYFRHHRQREAFETIADGEVRIPRLWGDRLMSILGPPRKREEPISDRERDIAASVQRRYEEVFLQMIADLRRTTGHSKVVMGGGCALNSVANGRMLTEGYMNQAYFQPASSDDGTALGAALQVLHGCYGLPRGKEVRHAYWGSSWLDDDIERDLKRRGRSYQKLGRGELLRTTAAAIAEGKIVGWFQGREEWGPRALGNRSILCNPAFPEMKETLNSRIKHREPFRPFAPMVRLEDLSTVFHGSHPVPFMIVVYKVRSEWQERMPAITHEDGTGRVQTLTREQNELTYDLITEFFGRTGVPVLLNTSFNENEPIVHTPAQAIDCFERTKMDALCIGSYWTSK